MTTQTLVRKLNQEITDLKKDVSEIKRFILIAADDFEGEYRPEFIRKILQRAKEISRHRFTTKEAFLKQIYARGK